MGTSEKQVLKVLYQWGGEASKATIEENLQIIITKEMAELKAQGLVHLLGTSLVLTKKGIQAIETENIVPTQTVQENIRARELVKKALKSVLEGDLTGYNASMQDARKAFPPRFISAVQKYYLHNLP